MSLTTKEWEKMWESIQKLERAFEEIPPHSGYRGEARKEIKKIKNQIQQVIGQMESYSKI